jgi:hypothetical protein
MAINPARTLALLCKLKPFSRNLFVCVIERYEQRSFVFLLEIESPINLLIEHVHVEIDDHQVIC